MVMSRFLMVRFGAILLSSCILLAVESVRAAPVVAEVGESPWAAREYFAVSRVGMELTRGYQIELPRRTQALPGNVAAWKISVDSHAIPTHLQFQVVNNFLGAPRGHVFAQVRAGETRLWREDVGAFSRELVTLELEAAEVESNGIRLEGFVNRAVSNFPVRIVYSDLAWSFDGGETFEAINPYFEEEMVETVEQLPTPLEAAERTIPNWFTQSRALQPWSRTQTELMRNYAKWIPILRDQYGFNTLIIAELDGHNGIVRGREADMLNEAEFERAYRAFREAGFNIIFYASLVHSGHATEWHEDFGDPATRLPARFPEWLQRTADGVTIQRYGGRWLSPITGAFEHQVDYFAERVERWRPDGLMLDNHGFHFADHPDNLTGHEYPAKTLFGEFASARFGLGGEIVLPKDLKDPLRPFWLEWRNHAIADITERFRAEMRAVDPEILLSANIAFDYSTPALANDYVMNHLDTVITENKVTPPDRLLAKIAFGKAMSPGIPQWSYMGTFQTRAPDLLREPEFIREQFAAGMAAGAMPWVVFYGFDDRPENADSRIEMARQLQRWSLLQTLNPWGEPDGHLISIISPRERSFSGGLAIPLHAHQLSAFGHPLQMLRIKHLGDFKAEDGAILLLDDIRSITTIEAEHIARLLAAGTQVVATKESGWRDALGRWREASVLAPLLDAEGFHLVDDTEALLSKAASIRSPIISSESAIAWSQLYRQQDSKWLHFYVEEPAENGLSIRLNMPLENATLQRVCWQSGELVPVVHGEASGSISLPTEENYHILKIQNHSN